MKTANVIIIGAGPAGLFCAEELLNKGVKSILMIDSGKFIHDRICPQSSKCDCEVCDILEGIGGAGGFSDGKMTLSLERGTQTEQIFSEEHRKLLDEVDQVMVEYGEPGVLFDPANEPLDTSELRRVIKHAGFRFESYKLRHMGSDGAQRMIANQEESLIHRGVNIMTMTSVRELIRDVGQREIKGVVLQSGERVFSNHVVIATGLQGSPWVAEQARQMGIALGQGPAGFGIRLEARAEILEPLFKEFYDFKMELDCPIGPLRSFCCNREGYIVNENHRTLMVRNVNGHSYLSPALKTGSSNFAIIAKVDVKETWPMSPHAWVRDVARKINALNGGMTAVQLVDDFMKGEASAVKLCPVRTNYQAVLGADISKAMPDKLRDSFKKFLEALDKALPNGLGPEALIYGPEIKYYSRRFPVDSNWESKDVADLYVVGNASGYLDSYVSAAVSGIIAARNIAKYYEVQ